MTETILLSAQQLSRRFGVQQAVDNVSFNIRQGEVLGFLGPNGAGKSTTMKMLSGNLAPDTGRIIINGNDLLDSPREAKQHLGYLPENPPLYREMTVNEFLAFCARLHEIPATQQKNALDLANLRCGLTEVRHRLIGQLSKGYQQRVGIAQAIIHNPAVVILDEPTSGLDPLQIHEIRKLIREIANAHSVILSTHVLPEVEMLCDKVQIIAKGKLVFNDSLSQLRAQRQSCCLFIELSTPPSLFELKQITGVSKVEATNQKQFRLHYLPQHDPTEALLKKALNEKWGLRQLIPESDSLENIFMQLVNDDQTAVGVD